MQICQLHHEIKFTKLNHFKFPNSKDRNHQEETQNPNYAAIVPKLERITINRIKAEIRIEGEVEKPDETEEEDDQKKNPRASSRRLGLRVRTSTDHFLFLS